MTRKSRFSSLLALLPFAVLATACTSLQPAIDTAPSDKFSLVDPAKVDAAQYAVDYAACAALANQNETGVTGKVTDVARTAANKASFGVVGSSKSAQADRSGVLRKCLTGRGYTVLR
jgi:hypothetical protein